MSSLSQVECVGVLSQRFDVIFSPFEVSSTTRRFQCHTRIVGSTVVAVAGGSTKQVPVDMRMCFERRIEADQFSQQIPLPLRRFRREGSIPVRQRRFRSVVIVTAEMDTEEDVHQGRPQFADGDVGFPTKMDGLKHLEKPLPGASLPSCRAGKSLGTEHPRCPANFATILGRARFARLPYHRRLLSAVQTVEQAVEEAGFDPCLVSCFVEYRTPDE